MSSKMLIDASHPEETRVVVLKGNRIEEFDFEAANKKQLRGNIYLAKVTRVEPSLQAAFIDYGGNRHGFLAFSEIHPDYYQIPHADRQALLEEEARAHRDEDDDSRGGGARRSRRSRRDGPERASDRRGPTEDRISSAEDQPKESDAQAWVEGPAAFDGEADEVLEASGDVVEEDGAATRSADDAPDSRPAEAALSPEAEESSERDSNAAAETPDDPGAETGSSSQDFEETATDADPLSSASLSDEASTVLIEGGGDSLLDLSTVDVGDAAGFADDQGHDEGEEDFVEQIGGDALEDSAPRAPRPRRHHYKIQEVIKRRQILLVQVVKEERGNKGAALTTYLSLAGRYSVLMPNTARGGGISRKITDSEDRKRLKSIAQDLEVPEGMGIILRTAGASRSKIEVNRDFEYLLRMWESVRELTLKSTAPSLVYEEGSLIKRSIRDLYTREIEDVIVSGDEGFREAQEFMRMLMPGAAKSVQLYKDPQPIFARAGAEAQLDAMFSNHVTLKSGGYLVINQTEALVAIDVNSGRSTREHNIEDTALRTNLEAADEVARQLRLRDLAGLIVVDFIDMEEGRNNRAVERRIKEALKNDRARIQIGRISHFGLLEMSRQRIRTGVLEGSTVICPHCAGAGTIRSTASIALHVLRLLEDALIKDASHNLVVRTRTEVALYILNQKRAKLSDLEARFGVSLMITVDITLNGMIYHAIERGDPAMPAPAPAPRLELVRVDSIAPIYDEADDEIEAEEEAGEEAGAELEGSSNERDEARGEGSAEGGRRRKRRRRRRGRDRDLIGDVAADAPQPSDDGLATMARIEGDFPPIGGTETDEQDGGASGPADLEAVEGERPERAVAEEPVLAAGSQDDVELVEQPRRRRSRRGAKAEAEAAAGSASVAAARDETGDEATPPPRRRRGRAKVDTAGPTTADAPVEVVPADTLTSDLSLGAESRPAMSEAASAPSDPRYGAPSPVDEAAPAPVSPVPADSRTPDAITPAEDAGPALPKRSGWWQRAKATFGS